MTNNIGEQNMTLHYHEVEQGSDEWLELRRGIITASEVGLLMTPTMKTPNNDKSRAHLYSLVAQRISGYVEPTFISDDMIRGMDQEPIARELYAEKYGPVTERGFYILERDGVKLGYSPDGETFDGGGIEVKGRRQNHHVRIVLGNEAPAENILQIQTGLLVTGWDYIDYVQICYGMALYVTRVYPDLDMHEKIWNMCIDAEAKMQEMQERYMEITKGAVIVDRPADEVEVYLG